MSEAFELVVPAEVASLGARFAELDQVMQAWLAAMSTAQRVLGEALGGGQPAAHEPPRQQPECRVEPPAEPVEPPQPIQPEPSAAVEVQAPAQVAPAPAKPAAVRVGIRSMIAEAAAARGPEPKTDKALAAESDEALLASLDPETAQAVRIMRRMNVAGKSVRELVEEYQASKAGQAPAAAKRSWWKRG